MNAIRSNPRLDEATKLSTIARLAETCTSLLARSSPPRVAQAICHLASIRSLAKDGAL
jgi:hypothetical protein